MLRAAIFTLSDSRRLETDDSGRIMATMLREAGHEVEAHEVLREDPEAVLRRLRSAGRNPRLDMLLINGGTGITSRDRTVEVVSAVLERTLPGFGEIFRALSYRQIGPAAMASRAVAGVFMKKLVFCTPGSPGAVRLAMERLILPGASHLVGELRKGS
ncbi:MAG: molybdenum cofactor biosynthesis protein B [Acidobacteriota bacterium]